MMMQELPMEQMGLAGSDRRMPPLERLDPTEIKQEFLPFDKKLMSPPEHTRLSTWPHPENFEDEQRAKNALTDAPGPVTFKEFQEDQMTQSEEERYNGQNPFSHGTPSGGLPEHHEHHEHHYSPEQIMHNGVAHIGDTNGGGPPGPNSSAAKKTSSRRNAWGNLSYADLITQAISASPEKRLTLSQVYDWMVQNIPYFKDKGDSNSSAGWKVNDTMPCRHKTMKNSIRHNLSLHNRFVRVQNEGTGKSSWWMLNPDAKAGGKASRRRASTADSGKCGFDSKRRGRSKKSLDLVRNGQESTPSPNGHMEGFPESPSLHPGFQFPHDMRGRAGSNASEYGGRISPLRHPNEFFQEGGWPGQEFGQCFPGAPFGRPPFLEGGEPDPGMMDPRLSPHPGLAHHLGRPNGFPYPRPGGFPHPEYPQSPLLPPQHPEHPQFSNLGTMSPAHVPSLSPNPHTFPSPDHHPPTSSHEPLMSPHHLNGPGVFFPSCAMSGAASPDSPAPGSSSSSGSILERALVKNEPESPHPHHPAHPLPTTTHQAISAGMDVLNNSTVTSPGHPHPHPHHHPELHHHQPHQPHDWPIITQGLGPFDGVNVEDYIKHDYDMDNHMATFAGYNQGQGPPHPQNEEHQHSQYQPHNTSVSVGPPWVR